MADSCACFFAGSGNTEQHMVDASTSAVAGPYDEAASVLESKEQKVLHGTSSIPYFLLGCPKINVLFLNTVIQNIGPLLWRYVTLIFNSIILFSISV